MKKGGKTSLSLLSYLFFNIALTLHSKWTMSRSGLQAPWLLSAIHCIFSGFGSILLLWMLSRSSDSNSSDGDGGFGASGSSANGILITNTDTTIDQQQKQQPKTKINNDLPELLLYSSLFTINIAFSNWSLEVSSILINQSMKALSSPITMLLEFLTLAKIPQTTKIASLLPIVLGIPLICFDQASASAASGNTTNTATSVWISLLSVAISSVKIVETKRLLVKGYDPLRLIVLMSLPAVLQSTAVSYCMGEFGVLRRLDRDVMAVLSINGLLAFALNVTAFYSTKLTSALSMSVIGSIKQLTSILLGLLIFKTRVTPSFLGISGISSVVLGMILYVVACNNNHRFSL